MTAWPPTTKCISSKGLHTHLLETSSCRHRRALNSVPLLLRLLPLPR